MSVENPSACFVDYWLRILGIRVWEHSCQLVARSGEVWIKLGPRWGLPMSVPRNAEELKAASEEPLRLTAYQHCSEYPGSDLKDMLEKTGNFSAAVQLPAGEAALTGALGSQ